MRIRFRRRRPDPRVIEFVTPLAPGEPVVHARAGRSVPFDDAVGSMMEWIKAYGSQAPTSSRTAILRLSERSIERLGGREVVEEQTRQIARRFGFADGVVEIFGDEYES